MQFDRRLTPCAIGLKLLRQFDRVPTYRYVTTADAMLLLSQLQGTCLSGFLSFWGFIVTPAGRSSDNFLCH